MPINPVNTASAGVHDGSSATRNEQIAQAVKEMQTNLAARDPGAAAKALAGLQNLVQASGLGSQLKGGLQALAQALAGASGGGNLDAANAALNSLLIGLKNASNAAPRPSLEAPSQAITDVVTLLSTRSSGAPPLLASDLPGAAKIFALLQQLGQAGGARSGLPPQLATGLQALGEAVVAGSLAKVNAALISLQNDPKAWSPSQLPSQLRDQAQKGAPPQGTATTSGPKLLLASDLPGAAKITALLQRLVQVSSGPIASGPQGPLQSGQPLSASQWNALQALGEALAAGNLDAANVALSSLEAALSRSPSGESSLPVTDVVHLLSTAADPTLLRASDLAGAAKIFVVLQKLEQANQAQPSSTSKFAQLESGIGALGEALAGGNLDQANAALSSIEADLQNAAAGPQAGETPSPMANGTAPPANGLVSMRTTGNPPALEARDLSGAARALSSLPALLQPGSDPSDAPALSSQWKADLHALGEALAAATLDETSIASGSVATDGKGAPNVAAGPTSSQPVDDPSLLLNVRASYNQALLANAENLDSNELSSLGALYAANITAVTEAGNSAAKKAFVGPAFIPPPPGKLPEGAYGWLFHRKRRLLALLPGEPETEIDHWFY